MLQRKIIFIGIIFAFIVSLFFFYISLTKRPSINKTNTSTQQREPTITPFTRQVKKISPLQKTVVGETPTTPLESLPTFIKKETLADGTHYTFKNELIVRPDEVLIKDSLPIFERIVLPESSAATGYAKMQQLREQFSLGKPDAEIKGSSLYGEFITYYIYASKGITIIGNPFTDEVFEINTFTPTTTEGYIQNYGQDIHQRSEIIEKH